MLLFTANCLLKKDEIILSYEEFCKQNGTIPSSVDENPSVQTKVEQNQEISKPEWYDEAPSSWRISVTKIWSYTVVPWNRPSISRGTYI